MARMNAPSAVTQRRPDSRIISMPTTLGTPVTSAITMSGRTLAFTSRVDAIPAICPTARPTSIAPASSHARGRAITLGTISPPLHVRTVRHAGSRPKLRSCDQPLTYARVVSDSMPDVGSPTQLADALEATGYLAD